MASLLAACAALAFSTGAGVVTNSQPEPAQPTTAQPTTAQPTTAPPPVAPAPPKLPPFQIVANGEIPLSQIIDLIRKDLGIQVFYADDLSDKKIYLPAPIQIPGDRVLYFLTLLLEQKGYTLIRTDLGIYTIVPIENIHGGGLENADAQAPTQIVYTRGLKPSTLKDQMNIIGGLDKAVYNDDLGVIIVTDSPGKIDLLRQLIDRLVQIRDSVQFIPYEVHNISAVTARDRILALAGEMAGMQGQATNPTPGVQPGSKQIPGIQQGGTSVTQGNGNLTFQLLVDPQSNSLLFRGRPEEKTYVEALLQIVDTPNKMKSVFYPVGVRAAEVISFQGSREGLGDVTTYQSTTDENAGGVNGLQLPRPGFPTPGQQQQQQQQGQGGNNTAGFVIYPEAGGFMYHGTPEQHARIGVLAESLKQLSQGDLITMEFYKLKNAKAEDVVSIIGSLLGEESTSANQGSILGGDLSQRNSRRNQRNQSANPNNPLSNDQSSRRGTTGTSSNSSGGGLGAVGNDETSVIEDQKNNQVIVKTRQRLQPDFAKLIQRLDSRRPQVYVNAQIIAVTDSQNNRLAVETQIIAGQFGLNTNFGLSSFGDMGFQSAKTVATGLPAFTAALIRSDSVPFIITALQNNTDSRILATPQLLVDDNESASVVSENEVPTSVTRTPSSGDTITSVGDPARAGTSLDVTPQISENAVKLDISIEQSSFTGEATATLPPPTQRNTLSSLVTVPRDCTIVIGGLTLESDTKTVVKVPLLGDIPLAGVLFRDTVTRKQRATLYVFLTPTIMADPNFADVRLLTKGPAAEVKLDSDRMMPPPELKPMKIGSPIMPGPPPAEPLEERPPAPPSLPGPVDIHAIPAEEKGPMVRKSPA